MLHFIYGQIKNREYLIIDLPTVLLIKYIVGVPLDLPEIPGKDMFPAPLSVTM